MLEQSRIYSRPALPPTDGAKQAEVAAAVLPEKDIPDELASSSDQMLTSKPGASALLATFDETYDLLPEGPVISTPLATEQPPAFMASNLAQTNQPRHEETSASAARILLLPYHDKPNPNNLIPITGGGEVVTTIFGARLSTSPGIIVLWDATGQASHDHLISQEEAIQLGKITGADYVVRGQVLEFRRAQSVPSLYSVVLSTAILATQVVFAEFSGVDVATEMYRVSDGVCVLSRRDRAQQKYVVQAEKTVRKLAENITISIDTVLNSTNAASANPLIDTL